MRSQEPRGGDRSQRRRFGRRFVGGGALFMGLAGLLWTGFWVLGGVWLASESVWVGLGALWATLLVLLGVTVVWGRIASRRRPAVFDAFNEAFLRIARGDYTVQIPLVPTDGRGPEQPFQKMAQNINAMAGALARMEDLRQQFVADVSHEFQSPLTSILGFSQALRGDALPEELRLRYLGIIESEARRLSRLADTLLKLNSLEGREGPPDPTLFRLDVQLRRVLVGLEPQWSSKGLRIEADLAEVQIEGNEGLWTQVWTNLLNNAIKFTPPGGEVTVNLFGGTTWQVDVTDTGIGLTSEEADRVFERFYKAESARSYQEGVSGSGLGLALVQRIVTLHGGRVIALSPGIGQGTTLRVFSGHPS